MTPFAKSVMAGVIALAGMSGLAAAFPVPSFDTFGTLPGATFGGSGIPNDAVAITSFTTDSGHTITLGLTAHERFSEPPVENDGAGTFSALAGGFPGSPSLARWNFAYYVDITGGGTFADYTFKLLYDFDPAAGNSGHGVIDFSAALAALTIPPAAVSRVEDSQNLGFGFLATTGSGITAPSFASFNPNAIGQYTFSLQAFADPGMTTLLGEAAIQVNTVPEPLSASLFAPGAAGMALVGYRRRRKSRTA